MFVFWGSKRVEQTLGRVADFCPICRGIGAFDLVRIGMAGHVYYLSVGKGTLVGHLIHCTKCGVKLDADPLRYTEYQKNPTLELEDLIRTTFPALREFHTERLELEDKVAGAVTSIDPETRNRLLMEPFFLLNPLVEQRFANSTEMDKPSGIGCLGTVLLGGGLFFGSMNFRGTTSDNLLIAAAILFGVGTIYTLIQMHLGPKRFFQTRVVPQLIESLDPLSPTKAEVEACVQRCKKLGLKIGTVTKPAKIYALLCP